MFYLQLYEKSFSFFFPFFTHYWKFFFAEIATTNYCWIKKQISPLLHSVYKICVFEITQIQWIMTDFSFLAELFLWNACQMASEALNVIQWPWCNKDDVTKSQAFVKCSGVLLNVFRGMHFAVYTSEKIFWVVIQRHSYYFAYSILRRNEKDRTNFKM